MSATGTVIRDMDDGGGGPPYRIHFEVTSPFVPAKTYGPPESCYPAEAAEYEITGIDCEAWNGDRKSFWVPIERTHDKLEAEAVYDWAEGLDLSDETVEAIEGEREAYLEQQAECRADALAELHHEREGR